MAARKKTKAKSAAKAALSRKPRLLGWQTSDADEIELRRLRASLGGLKVEALEPDIPFYGTFRVRSSSSPRSYIVEIRSLLDHENSCECPDFQGNGLGTCKHIERVLLFLRKGRVRLFKQAARAGPSRVEIYLSRRGKPGVRIAWPPRCPPAVRKCVGPFFSHTNELLADAAQAVPALERALSAARKPVQRSVRVARDVTAWAADLRQREDRLKARKSFTRDVKAGKRAKGGLQHPLYPYQEEGMLHLAFGERAMLADDMGLGKTVQAIAACELLRRSRGIERVLVVCPASLKAEWEDQIAKFTGASIRIVSGTRAARSKAYREPAFFTITNYEQIRNDVADINALITPDVVILDEAQRIKNWQTKTAKSVKHLSSPSAFVLTGTPLENRIDEIYSIVEFLDPQIFGPLFRFNRDFYDLDERGRPAGYKNLDELHRRLRPIMLRRRKSDVEDQLPSRTVNTYFVPMEEEQRLRYDEYSSRAARILAILKRRPLRKEEMEKLQRLLACMRMVCDTPYILDSNCRICPKLGELASVLEEVLQEEKTKVLVFSEWERMLQLVRDLSEQMRLDFAWHTGSVSQKRRRKEIHRFKEDPDCRLFLSTDSGSTGLNLQAANVVINMDLPWNPARLEQRIARAWRKHQTRPVSVVHLVAEKSIEHRMLSTLAHKQQLADGVVDGIGEVKAMPLTSGRAAFVERLEALMGEPVEAERVAAPRAEPATVRKDPYETYRDDLAARISDRLLLMEARKDAQGKESMFVVVDGDVEQVRPLASRLLKQNFPGAEGEQVNLEMIDRSTYATIQRLVNSGVLNINSQAARQVYATDTLAESRRKEQQRRFEEAREVFKKAERKWKMGLVLRDGGFAIEALSPLREASEITLKALCRLQGAADTSEDPLPLQHVEMILSQTSLPETALTTIEYLRDINDSGRDVNEEEACRLVRDADRLVLGARQIISKAALE